MDMPAELSEIVDILAPHQLESGIVTWDELHLVERWMDSIAPDKGTIPRDDWFNQWINTAIPFSFRYDGKEHTSILGSCNIQKLPQKSDMHSEQYEFIWTDKATGLKLQWLIKRFLKYPAVEWVLFFENTGIADTPIIEDIQALSLRLNHSQNGRRYTIHGVAGGRSLPDDMIPFSWDLPSDAEMQLGGDHPSSNRHLPFFNLETPEDRGVIVGVGWSGNWLAKAKVNNTQLNVNVGLKESRFILHPGEKIRTPRVLLLFWQGKRLHGYNMLRQLLHKQYVPKLRNKQQQPLVSVNVCFTHHGRGGFLHQATEKEVLSLVQPFTELGSELLIIDAGWYDGEPWHEWLGNWRYSREKYPHGFRPISEPLAAANVAFGLWFASENVSKISPLLKEHPEWVRNGTLRMELPEAREWFLKQVDDLVESQLMNCYRQDGAGGYGEESNDRKGISESQHVAGLYTLWDTLVERHPDLIMEGCCGGGRRIDLETLSRFHWHQKSDRWFDSESDQCSLYGANLFLPGGVINIPTEAVDNYGAWSSFAGQFCLGWHPLDADFHTELAQRQVNLYKSIRQLLSGDFYPLTPCSLEETWIGYQFHRVDLDAGFILVFRRPVSKKALYPASNTFRIHFRGVDPGKNYHLHFQQNDREEVLTGGVLAGGIDIVIGEEKGAEMIIYSPARKP